MPQERLWKEYVGRTAQRYPTAALIHRIGSWVANPLWVILVVGLTIALPSPVWTVPFVALLVGILANAWLAVFLATQMLNLCVGTDLFDLAAEKISSLKLRAYGVTILVAVTVVGMAFAARFAEGLR